MRRTSMAGFLLVLVHGVFAVHALAAQSENPLRILAGDSTVNGGFMIPHRVMRRQIVTRPDGVVLNARQWVTEELRIDTTAGRRVATRILWLHRYDGEVYAADTVVFEPATMMPIMSVEHVAGTTAWRRRFDGRRVHGQALAAEPGGSGLGIPDGQVGPPLDVLLPQPAFDFHSLYGLLLAAFPLDSGYQATFPVFAERGDSLAWLTFRITRQEPVEAGEGRFRQAWVAEMSTPDGPKTFWLSREAPYVLKQQDVLLRDGKPYRLYTWLTL